MLFFLHILEICFQPHMFCTNFGIDLKMLFFLHILKICFQPPNVCHKNRERIKNVGFYTHPRNMFPPHKCLAQILGYNWQFWVLYTSHKYVWWSISYLSIVYIVYIVGFFTITEKWKLFQFWHYCCLCRILFSAWRGLVSKALAINVSNISSL